MNELEVELRTVEPKARTIFIEPDVLRPPEEVPTSLTGRGPRSAAFVAACREALLMRVECRTARGS